jgi:hypothetical protein
MSVVNFLGVALEAKESASFLIAEGQYPAVIVGLVVDQRTKFESEELEPKVTLVWQIFANRHTDDDEVMGEAFTTTITSDNYTIGTGLYEKSALTKMLMSWSKSATPKEVVEKLKSPVTGVFSLETLLGKKAILTITHTASKKEKNKLYNKISGVGSIKLALVKEFDPSVSVPFYIHTPNAPKLQDVWLPGVVLAEKKEKKEFKDPESKEISTPAPEVFNDIISGDDDEAVF